MNATMTPANQDAPPKPESEATLAAPSGSVSGRDQYNDLKLEINRLIWQYAPAETTLGMADEMACKILTSILAGKYLL